MLGLALALSVGCGSSESESRGCVSGQSVACIGPEGCSGYQVCSDDGERFEPCVCPVATAATGGASTLATGGLSGGGRAGPPSGASAAGGPSAPGGGGAGGDAKETEATGGAAVDCAPAEMNDWAPSAYVPARAPEHVCGEALIRQYYADCLNSADCASFDAGGEYAECGECLRPTAAHDAEYGPLILSGVIRETNFAGCIELVGEAGCAVHQQDKSRCEHEACYASCPVTDTDSLALYRECKLQARSGVCSTYREAAVCIVDPAHVEACSGDDFEESFVSIGMVFCGGLASPGS